MAKSEGQSGWPHFIHQDLILPRGPGGGHSRKQGVSYMSPPRGFLSQGPGPPSPCATETSGVELGAGLGGSSNPPWHRPQPSQPLALSQSPLFLSCKALCFFTSLWETSQRFQNAALKRKVNLQRDSSNVGPNPIPPPPR